MYYCKIQIVSKHQFLNYLLLRSDIDCDIYILIMKRERHVGDKLCFAHWKWCVYSLLDGSISCFRMAHIYLWSLHRTNISSLSIPWNMHANNPRVSVSLINDPSTSVSLIHLCCLWNLILNHLIFYSQIYTNPPGSVRCTLQISLVK